MQNNNLRSSDALYSTHGIPQNVRMKGRRNKPDSYNSFRFQTAFCMFQAVASMIRFRPFCFVIVVVEFSTCRKDQNKKTDTKLVGLRIYVSASLFL